MARASRPEELWRDWLTRHSSALTVERRVFKLLPNPPRCKMCNVPFAGPGGLIMRLLGWRRWEKNPNLCTRCELHARKHRGGAEVELTLLFADVRGSTTVAERISPSEFTALMNRFYTVATRVLIETDAVIDKLVGDEVIGLYLPFLDEPAPSAVRAARKLLRETGHGGPNGPWLPVGIGVHTGTAFVGFVGGEDTVTDFTALGDAVNVTARLASAAEAGEILLSDEAYAASKLQDSFERRQLKLKGRSEPVGVHVLTIGPRA